MKKDMRSSGLQRPLIGGEEDGEGEEVSPTAELELYNMNLQVINTNFVVGSTLHYITRRGYKIDENMLSCWQALF